VDAIGVRRAAEGRGAVVINGATVVTAGDGPGEVAGEEREATDIQCAGIIDRTAPGPGAGGLIVLDGQVVGTWKRTLTKNTVFIVLSPFRALNDAELYAVTAAVGRYGAFLGLPVNMTFQVE